MRHAAGRVRHAGKLSYAQTVLQDAPLIYWRQGDASGTTMTDSSGHARHGSYVNTPTLGVPGLLTSDTDKAVQYAAASSQYGQYPMATGDTAIYQSNVWTIECLFKPTATGQAGKGIISRQFHSGGTGIQFVMGLGHNNNGTDNDMPWVGFYDSGNVWRMVASTTALTSGSIYHLAGTWDGTTMNLVRNGAVEVTGTPGGSVVWDQGAVYVGVDWGTGYVSGVIDEVAIYGAALTPARLAAHHAAA